MTNARDVLNKLTWDKRFNTGNYAVIFVHRGAPHDLKVIKASAIRRIEKSFFIIEEDTMIPFHRIRAIRELRNGEDIFIKDEGVPFPLQEIEGHDGLGEFQDEAHTPHLAKSVEDHRATIRCGARLSFPESDPESFRRRAKEGIGRFGIVELSFFRYSGSSEESQRYEHMINFAEKVIDETNLKVISLHLPNINILNKTKTARMLDAFLPFCAQIHCKSIVVHPGILDLGHSSRADRDQAELDLRDILAGVSGQLEENRITLSLENYPEKNRVPSGILDMYNFVSNLPPVYQIAFDTSHTIGNTDSVIEDIVRNVGKIALFHFSNRCGDERHMPIFSSKGELNFSRVIDAIRSSRFNGMIILEYQPKRYRMLLERDLKMLRDAICQT
jgi:uncharacterized protein (UPF0248 family)/sugar phosphate isomerase/epimerase